jgi:hypothetical protein
MMTALNTERRTDMTNKTDKEMSQLYKRATVSTSESCGLATKNCASCMYLEIPVDYEKTGFHAYCVKERK